MTQMTICMIIFVLTLIGFAVGSKYVSLATIALIGMLAMVFTGCLDAKTALGGFGNSSAIRWRACLLWRRASTGPK